MPAVSAAAFPHRLIVSRLVTRLATQRVLAATVVLGVLFVVARDLFAPASALHLAASTSVSMRVVCFGAVASLIVLGLSVPIFAVFGTPPLVNEQEAALLDLGLVPYRDWFLMGTLRSLRTAAGAVGVLVLVSAAFVPVRLELVLLALVNVGAATWFANAWIAFAGSVFARFGASASLVVPIAAIAMAAGLLALETLAAVRGLSLTPLELDAMAILGLILLAELLRGFHPVRETSLGCPGLLGGGSRAKRASMSPSPANRTVGVLSRATGGAAVALLLSRQTLHSPARLVRGCLAAASFIATATWISRTATTHDGLIVTASLIAAAGAVWTSFDSRAVLSHVLHPFWQLAISDVRDGLRWTVIDSCAVPLTSVLMSEIALGLTHASIVGLSALPLAACSVLARALIVIVDVRLPGHDRFDIIGIVASTLCASVASLPILGFASIVSSSPIWASACGLLIAGLALLAAAAGLDRSYRQR